MKQLIVVSLLVVLAASVFVSCGKTNKTWEDTTSLSEQMPIDQIYWNAYINCITYIETSSNANRGIDTSIVSVEILNVNQKEFVHIMDEDDESNFKDAESEYWLFTIGDTKDHNYILLVCDSQSDKVIGAILAK